MTIPDELSTNASEAKKLVVVGSAGCGKSALIHQFMNNDFLETYQQTFGAELVVKSSADGKGSTYHIWCCGGHERYRVLLDQFYKNSKAAIICFDMQSMDSFRDVPFWYNELKRCAPDAFVMLVGTKSDEVDNVIVKTGDVMKLARDWGVEFQVVSSKTGSNVKELFELVMNKIS